MTEKPLYSESKTQQIFQKPMTKDTGHFQNNKALSEEELIAIKWHIQVMREDASAEIRKDFEAWLEASPKNSEAYSAVTCLWDEVAALANGERKRAPITLANNGQQSSSIKRDHWITSERLWSMVGGGVMLALLAIFFVQLNYTAQPYRTALGEQHEITLPDGSILMLNTASSVEVHFRKNARLVRLLDGQASFSVAHDEDRPFVVFAVNSAVLAVGTEFDVLKHGDDLKVTLLEGAVDVAAGISELQALKGFATTERNSVLEVAELEPGEQIVIDAATNYVSPITEIDVERFMAWREGKASFLNTPLIDAIEEMNRYSTVKIRLKDDDLGGLLISGVFGVHNSDNFRNAVETLFDLDSRIQGNTVILIRKEAA